MTDLITATFFSILAAGFIVGVVVGLTGMGGGALMTPALIFLGVGDAATVVTADLTAAAVYKTGGAIVHSREGSPNLDLAKWLVLGSVPFALLGPHLVAWFTDPDSIDQVLKMCIGFALLMAAATYAIRLYVNLRRVRANGPQGDPNPKIRPIPTLLVGALGGLLVGVTSVGSGSVIMVALLMLYPGLSAVKLVGTDLVQAVPLVLAAAISNIALNGLDLSPDHPADPGLGARHHHRQQDRAQGAAVVHPARHRGRPDHVGRGAAGQGRLGAAGRGRGRHAPAAHRRDRPRHGGGRPADLGGAAQGAGPADVRRTHGRRARERQSRPHPRPQSRVTSPPQIAPVATAPPKRQLSPKVTTRIR